MARSDNWRINRSGIMAVEGAQVLKALQKVAGAAGLPKGFVVKFATKSHKSGIDFDTKEVVIGAGRLFNEAPVPADLFDVLVGLTLHEVGHQQIDSAKVCDLVKWQVSNGKTKQESDMFQKFVNIGEDIVIESRTRANPNLVEYDETLHKWAITQMRDAQPDKLMEVWIEYALGHKSTTIMNLPKELIEPMQQLVALTGWLRKNPRIHPSDRVNAYTKYWDTVKDAILDPLQPQPQQDAGADDKQNETEPPSDSGAEQSPQEPSEQDNTAGGDATGDASGEGNNSSAPDPDDSSGQAGEENVMDRPLALRQDDGIDDELAAAIEDAIESDLEDITEQVAEEFGEHLQDGGRYRKYPVIRSRETKTPLIKPDPLLRKKLERIMTIRKRLQARTMRGEQYGKIDKRHLHRVGTDERIFSLQYKFPDGFPDTRILIDLSASMSGKEAAEVLEAAGALQTLVNAEVWCYNKSDKVNLVRMDDGKLIHRFQPEGNTPSGLAIVGVSLGMKKGGLVIHLTDGDHNTGQTPWTANWILKKRGVDLVNLLWGHATRHYALEGINYRQLRGLAEFPEALYKILVEQTQLNKIGGK